MERGVTALLDGRARSVRARHPAAAAACREAAVFVLGRAAHAAAARAVLRTATPKAVRRVAHRNTAAHGNGRARKQKPRDGAPEGEARCARHTGATGRCARAWHSGALRLY